MQKKIYLTEISMMCALSFILSFFKIKIFAQGGSVSLVMVPIILISVKRGPLAGVVTGAVTGLLKSLTSSVFHPLSFFLDYIFAYSSIGLAGLLTRSVKTQKNEKKRKKNLVFATFSAVLLRFIFHTISGILIFSNGVSAGQNPWIYAINYNLVLFISNFAVTLTAVFLLRDILLKNII